MNFSNDQYGIIFMNREQPGNSEQMFSYQKAHYTQVDCILDLLDTEINVIPQPILQHHPTRHKIIVANWLNPMIKFMKNAQNRESPLHSSLWSFFFYKINWLTWLRSLVLSQAETIIIAV